MIIMQRLAAALVVLLLLVLPTGGAGPHLEPGTIVADGSPDQGVVVLLYVQGGYGDAQSVYTVQPVARCLDPAGSGWYALPSLGELRSAPHLEGAARVGTLDPDRLPRTCAAPAIEPTPTPRRTTGWDRLVTGTLRPFGPFT